MLTIKNNHTNESFTVKKSTVCDLLFNDNPNLLNNSTLALKKKSNTKINFSEIHEIFSSGKNVLTNSIDTKVYTEYWNTFKQILQTKTVFDELNVAKNGAISMLTHNIPADELMRGLRFVMFENCPVIKLYNLEKIYEQLVFYEYIYHDKTVSLYKKLELMLINSYSTLSILLNTLDLCIQTEDCNLDENSKIENLYHIYSSYDQRKIFIEFVNLHSEWLDFTLQNSTLLNTQTLLDSVVSNSFNEHIDELFPNNSTINFTELYILNDLYTNPDSVISLIKALWNRLDFTFVLNDKIANDHKLFNAVDLFVKILDDGELNELPTKTQEKLIAYWLEMNTIQSDFRHRSVRSLKLSSVIKEICSKMNLTFAGMNYILSTDHVELFDIFCQKLKFQTVHQTLFDYLPSRILDKVLNKTLEISDAKTELELEIVIGIRELVQHKPESIKNTIHKCKTIYSNVRIDIKSLNENTYMECLYISMYWNYLYLAVHFPQSVQNFIALLCSVDYRHVTNHYLDVVLFVTALENANVYDSFPVEFRKFLKSMKQDKKMFLRGPDFEEIKEELKRYSVKNMELLTSLEEINNSMYHD